MFALNRYRFCISKLPPSRDIESTFYEGNEADMSIPWFPELAGSWKTLWEIQEFPGLFESTRKPVNFTLAASKAA